MQCHSIIELYVSRTVDGGLSDVFIIAITIAIAIDIAETPRHGGGGILTAVVAIIDGLSIAGESDMAGVADTEGIGIADRGGAFLIEEGEGANAAGAEVSDMIDASEIVIEVGIIGECRSDEAGSGAKVAVTESRASCVAHGKRSNKSTRDRRKRRRRRSK